MEWYKLEIEKSLNSGELHKNSMNYFGTDGIRRRDEDFNFCLLNKIANGIVNFFEINKLTTPLFVSNDSRLSSDSIMVGIARKLLTHGIDIINVGMCSSPCLAFIAKSNHAYAMMISASHNSSGYNGVKFFTPNGEKVDDEFEEKFSALMDKKITRRKKYAKLNFSKKTRGKLY